MENLNKRESFITQGDITKVIFSVSLPLIINYLIRTVYTLTDGLFVAQLSPLDFTATSFVWPLNYAFISIGMGIGIGSTSLISQLLGAGQGKRSSKYACNAIFMALALGSVLAVIGAIFCEDIIALMGAEGELLEKSTTYLRICFIGLFFDFVYFSYQAILTSQGITKPITQISFITSITNVVLDPIFIFDRVPIFGFPGLGLGIAGAAWATVIAKTLDFILIRYMAKSQSKMEVVLDLGLIDKDVMKHILKISLPSALGNGGSALGFTMLNALIEGYGTTTLTAYSIINRITDLFTQAQNGIGSGLTSIIGQNMGAEKYDRTKKIFKRALIIIGILSVISLLICIVFRYPLLSIFIKEGSSQDLWDQSLNYLYFSAFIIFFMGFFSALIGFFQGVGRTSYSMIMSTGRLWILRLPLIWIFSRFTNLGPNGVWWSMVLSNALICLYGFYIYFTRDWKKLADI